jgi:transcriptional antiterminator NusG
VRVIEGPFVNFNGTIEDMSPERGKLKVMVQIFGRLTPVELEYYQVERG